jgi:hypothetical protein
MPTVDVEAQRKAARRAYLKGLKRGDMIQCALPMRAVAMRCDGRLLDMTPEPSAAQIEAERKAKADADRAWFLKSLGPW